MSNWAEAFQNPKALALKKFMSQAIPPDKLHLYDEILTRMGHALVTDNDLRLYCEMVNDVINIAFNKGSEAYKAELKKMGFNLASK